ncbi:MAG: ABC transporter substrate-binding protein [Solirubrobacteraceae bacterium]|nr:ABC transporter substrate-binding protein [Solirubrobacteraceae bacterium]
MNRSTSFAAALAVLAATGLAGCGDAAKKSGASTASGAASTDTTLNLAFQADMSSLDPDIYYDVEGDVVMLSVYEGLVKYKADSTEIEGALAESWEVSEDGQTYTFKLHDGVKFHDGTAMTSKSVKASIERRQAVKGGSGYMVADVDKITTPDDLTVVIHLGKPVDAFLDNLAGIWGPKVIGPEALVDNAAGDHGQKYLGTHTDGTGPYELTAFNRGTEYTLKANPAYWGSKPAYTDLSIKIVPDVSAQRLQLKEGSLDGILHSYTPSDIAAAQKDPALQVVEKPSFAKTVLYVNTSRPSTDSVEERKAIAASLDLPGMVSQVYGSTATPAKGPYPEGMIDGQPALDYGTTPKTAKVASGKLTLAYGPDAGGALARVAGLIQIQLEKLGYDVTLKAVQLPDTFDYKNDPEKAPDLLLLSPVPDAAHPDSWAQPFWTSKGGINAFGNPDTVLDGLVTKAQAASGEAADDAYKAVGQRVVGEASMLFIADVKDTFVMKKGITGFVGAPAYEWFLQPSALKPPAGE